MAANKLLIVESPSKAKTIKKYLGSTFIVKASVGHIRDLPKKNLGINIDEDFKPKYQTIKGKGDLVKELKAIAKKVDIVYIATDPDREGEAIGFHIQEILKKSNTNIQRVLFNEITKKAVKKAVKNPVQLDMGLVNAQQARRMLDRIVGYKLSPLLWKKIMKGLSAGRVQSIATKLVVDREEEINRFIPIEHWNIRASLEKEDIPFIATLTHVDGKKISPKGFHIQNKQESDEILAFLKDKELHLDKLEKKERKQNPVPPFTTSKLQQSASTMLGFSPKKTMMVAQKLYEGKNVGGSFGTMGLITYMRTDSVRISKDANDSLREFIEAEYGKNYLFAKARYFATKKSAQDAHEAIRPTEVTLKPDDIKEILTNDEYRLYSLIWKRFVATQMEPAIFNKTVATFVNDKYRFTANGETLKSKGFLVLYPNRKISKVILPNLIEKEDMLPKAILTEQKFTQPPARFTEASLIKKLEDEGIGRPSTYATIVTTIQTREYVEKEQGKFKPSDTGIKVTKQLVDFFPNIMDVAFTVKLEKELDALETEGGTYVDVLKRFYKGFSEKLDIAHKDMPSLKPKDIETDIVCEKCGEPMVIKTTKKGQFLACTGFPKCRNAKSFKFDENGKVEIVVEEIIYGKDPCPKCGKRMIFKSGMYGDYYACEDYPKICKTTRPVTLDIDCPTCGEGKIAKRKGKKGRDFYSCSRYPDCKFISSYKPINESCPECGSNYLIEKYSYKTKKTTIECPKKECKYKKE